VARQKQIVDSILAINNAIIEAHGGQMWAENKPEGGARVGFTLPTKKERKKRKKSSR
jgi:K+-sensing histidine kinase KdpD